MSEAAASWGRFRDIPGAESSLLLSGNDDSRGYSSAGTPTRGVTRQRERRLAGLLVSGNADSRGYS
jgi:hypothetical protein